MEMQCPNCGKMYDFAPSECGNNFTCEICMKRFTIRDLQAENQKIAAQKKKAQKSFMLKVLLVCLLLFSIIGGGGYYFWKKLIALPSAPVVAVDKMELKAGKIIKLIESKNTIDLAKALQNFDISWSGKDGESMLFYGVRSGDIQVVQLMLAKGFLINARKQNGENVLFEAVRKQDLAMMRFLIDKGANKDVTSRSESLWSAAAAAGSNEILQYMILSGFSFIDNIPGQDPAIFRALYSGNEEGVRILMKHYDLQSLCDSKGNSFAMACIEKEYWAWARKAISKANMDHRSNAGKSALFLSCMQENVLMVDFLLGLGADVNGDRLETAPVFAAVTKGNAYILNKLLQRKANLAQTGADGSDLLMAAVQNGNLDIVEKIYKAHKYELLRKNRKGENVYTLAVNNGQLEIANLLKDDYLQLLQVEVKKQLNAIANSKESYEKRCAALDSLLKDADGFDHLIKAVNELRMKIDQQHEAETKEREKKDSSANRNENKEVPLSAENL